MLDKIKNGLGKPAGWMYFILVVALLIIISNSSDVKANLQAEVDSLSDEISTLENTLEASANELAVRDDAIAGLNNAIASMESDSAAVNARLNDSDALRGDLEAKVSAGEEAISRLNQELSDTTTLLDVCTASQTQ